MKSIGWMFLGMAVLAGRAPAADVARIGSNTYATLHAAVAAAPSNATVELIGNAVLTNTLAIIRPLAIISDGAIRSITRTNAFAADLIYVQAPGSLTLGSPSGNDAAPVLYLDGGALNGVTGGYSFVFAENASVTMNPGVVLQRFCGLYAALYMYDTNGLASLTLNGGRFAENTNTNTPGGAVCSQGADIVIRDTVFAGNKALRGRGGAVYIEYAGLTATNLTIENNAADDYGGGLMGFPAEIDLTGGIFTGNTAINGGGIANGYGTVTISGTLFTNNRAFYGGGVWSHTGTNRILSAVLRNNQATNFGAALYSTSSRYTISNSQVIANTAGSNGGGLYVSPGTNPPSTVEILASVVSSNSGLYGGAIYNSYADLGITGSEFAGNHASGGGGALWLFGGTAIRDSRFAANVSSGDGGAIYHLGGPLALAGQSLFESNLAAAGTGIWCFNGPYEGSNAVLSISGGVAVAAGNDIALHTNVNAILLAGTLLAPGIIATVTPPGYSNGLPVLRDGPGLSFPPVTRYYAKFAVAPQAGSPTNWHIGTNGNLTASAPPAPPAPPVDMRDLIALSAAAGSNTFQLAVDPGLLEYDFAVQAATTVTNQAWNFQTLSNGYAAATNGVLTLTSPAPARVFRLVFP